MAKEGFMYWVLNSGKAFTLLNIISTLFGTLFFSALTVTMIFIKQWVFVALFGIFAVLSLKRAYKVISMVQKVGLDDVYCGLTANQAVWNKGDENGNGRCNNDEGGTGSNERPTGKIGEEVRCVYRKPKSNRKNDSDKLPNAKSNKLKIGAKRE